MSFRMQVFLISSSVNGFSSSSIMIDKFALVSVYSGSIFGFRFRSVFVPTSFRNGFRVKKKRLNASRFSRNFEAVFELNPLTLQISSRVGGLSSILLPKCDNSKSSFFCPRPSPKHPLATIIFDSEISDSITALILLKIRSLILTSNVGILRMSSIPRLRILTTEL